MSPQRKTIISLSERLLLLLLVGTLSIFLMKAFYTLGSAQSPESPSERKFKVQEFNDMPLEVKVKNLQSNEWHKDLEIAVKNVSGRPIYFILAYLTFPDDTPRSSSDEVGVSLHYGQAENIRISHLANPDDEHLDPDKSFVFTLPESIRIGFEARHKKYAGLDKNLLFRIALVSFGDGTGWEAGEPRDKRKRSPEHLERSELKKKRSNNPTGTLRKPSARNAFSGKYLAHALISTQGECGGGNGCSPWVIAGRFPTSCYCRATDWL